MCAGAVAWAGLREVVFGTSIRRLIELGWPQIDIGSGDIFDRAWRLGRKTEVIEGVLENEMDRWFGWQFRDGVCPDGCMKRNGHCVPGD